MIIIYVLPKSEPKKFESRSDTIIFGRKPRPDQYIDVDLRPDSYVSHVHACLSYEDSEYWIEDFDSENGTWVDDLKIQEKTRLRYGAKIRLGWTIIEIDREPAPMTGNEVVVDDSDKTTVSFDIFESVETVPPSEEGQVSEFDGTVINDNKVEKGAEPAPEGTITSVKDAFIPPFADVDGDITDDAQKQGWHQLKAMNDFIQALEADTTIERLGQILVEQLRNAIPNTQRGALLLPDQNGELLLKAHWPEGEHSVSMTWVKQAFIRREAFIWVASLPDEGGMDDDAPKSAIYYDVQSAIYVPLLAGGEVLGVMYVDNYFLRDAFSLTDFELLRAIANHVAMFLKDHVLREDLQRGEALRSNLLRQYSPKVADRILKKCGSLQRGGEQIDPVTILVSDVRNFTALSSKMEPDDVVRAINEMFDAFVPIISEMDGIVDKYVGDSVLAVFGSPEKDPHQWEKAVQGAIKMQEAMQKLGEGRKVRRLQIFQVGIGIHSGEVIHGFIGSAERIEFTVIGDTVNRAARYCDGAGPGEIIISKKVFERVYHLVDVSPKTIVTKHPDVEPNLEAYVVKGLRNKEK
ncbi:adenylate/guanylate cyclase domain-containing protein [Thermodesulfobacteriota bacterium]